MPSVKRAELKFNIGEKLAQRNGHKLRGFFADKYEEEVLFHHHKGDGNYKYGYPLIQYKIINGMPVVVSLAEGVDLLIDKFLEIEELTIGQEVYENPELQLNIEKVNLTVVETNQEILKFEYNFLSPWMGLNQKNFKRFKEEIINKKQEKQMTFLSKILIGNILSCAKELNWWIEKEIKVVPSLSRININFKDQAMIGFQGKFYSNVKLPEYIGLGQSTSRGFGTITRKKTF